MQRVEELANIFRTAIELAAEADEADSLGFFNRFPLGCCGDTSDLLAEYLLENKIVTKYVSGTYYYGETSYESQNHAWLLLDEEIIVDITGDQFKNNLKLLHYDKKVYVGHKNDFYDLFEVSPFRDIYEYVGSPLSTERLKRLYEIIKRYIKKPSIDEYILNASKKTNTLFYKEDDDSERMKEKGYPTRINEIE